MRPSARRSPRLRSCAIHGPRVRADRRDTGRHASRLVCGAAEAAERVLQRSVGGELDPGSQWSPLPSTSRSTARPPSRAAASSASSRSSVGRGSRAPRSVLRSRPSSCASRRATPGRATRSGRTASEPPVSSSSRSATRPGRSSPPAAAAYREIEIRREALAVDLDCERGRRLPLPLELLRPPRQLRGDALPRPDDPARPPDREAQSVPRTRPSRRRRRQRARRTRSHQRRRVLQTTAAQAREGAAPWRGSSSG